MAFNGAGLFQRLYNWVNDKNLAIPITASRMDDEMNGMATGLSTCLTKDGQTLPTANLPMNGLRHLNVANALNRNEYASLGQVQDSSVFWGGTATGTANALVLAPTPAMTSLSAGQRLQGLASANNTGATTVNYGGGVLNLKKRGYGGGSVALTVNDIVTGMLLDISYEGTQAILNNPFTHAHGTNIASAANVNLDLANGDYVYITGTTGITSITLSEGREVMTKFNGILTITSSGTLAPPGLVNYTTTVGDVLLWRGEAGGAVSCVGGMRVNGQQVGASLDNVVIGSATPAAAFVTAPLFGDSSQRAITSAWYGQNNLGGFLNKFRNPAFDIWQRGTSVTVPAGSTNITADSWYVGTVGAAALVNKGGQIEVGGSYSCLQITGNAGMTSTFIKQRIESSQANALNNQQVTIRIYMWNAATGVTLAPTLTVRTPTAQDNYTSTNAVLTGVSMQSLGSTIAGVLAYTFACPQSANNGIEIQIDFGASLNANTKYLYVTDWDIRPTPGVATGLNANSPLADLRPISIEYPITERHLMTYGDTIGPVEEATGVSATGFTVFLRAKNKMFAKPSGLTVATPGNFSIFTKAGVSVNAVTSLTYTDASQDGVYITGAVASGLAADVKYYFKVNTASAGNLVITGAEL